MIFLSRTLTLTAPPDMLQPPTTCKNGHSLVGPNLAVWVYRSGSRKGHVQFACKACQRMRNAMPRRRKQHREAQRRLKLRSERARAKGVAFIARKLQESGQTLRPGYLSNLTRGWTPREIAEVIRTGRPPSQSSGPPPSRAAPTGAARPLAPENAAYGNLSVSLNQLVRGRP